MIDFYDGNFTPFQLCNEQFWTPFNRTKVHIDNSHAVKAMPEPIPCCLTAWLYISFYDIYNIAVSLLHNDSPPFLWFFIVKDAPSQVERGGILRGPENELVIF